MIIGQIHGAEDISSVLFVMLYYDNGAVKAVVKQEQSGNAHTDIPPLPSVPVGAPFDYSITDGGDGNLTVTATDQGQTVSGSAWFWRRSPGRRCGSRPGPTSRPRRWGTPRHPTTAPA